MNSLADAAAAMEDWEEVKKIIIDDVLYQDALRNIHIRINPAEMPSYAALRAARHRVFGRGKWTGLWRFRILRNLFPNRHQRLVEEWREQYGRYRLEYLNALLREGRIAFDERQAET